VVAARAMCQIYVHIGICQVQGKAVDFALSFAPDAETSKTVERVEELR